MRWELCILQNIIGTFSPKFYYSSYCAQGWSWNTVSLLKHLTFLLLLILRIEIRALYLLGTPPH